MIGVPRLDGPSMGRRRGCSYTFCIFKRYTLGEYTLTAYLLTTLAMQAMSTITMPAQL